MAYTLEQVEIRRFSDAARFNTDALPELVQQEELGMAITSIHSGSVRPYPRTETNHGSTFHVTDIDQVSDGNYTATAKTAAGAIESVQTGFHLEKGRSLGAHIDPGYPAPVNRVRPNHHYTPLGSGLVRAARVKCTPEEWSALTLSSDGSHQDRIDEITFSLMGQFEKLAATPAHFRQGDVIMWFSSAQCYNGEYIFPIMHELTTTSDTRYAVIAG